MCMWLTSFSMWRNDASNGLKRSIPASIPRPRRDPAGGYRAPKTSALRAPGLRDPAGIRELAVDGVGGADQPEVRERLREVAQVLAVGTELLGVEPDVVRVPEHLLEHEPRLLRVARAGEHFCVPERAHVERALLAHHAVGRGIADAVAEHQRVLDEVVLDRLQVESHLGSVGLMNFIRGNISVEASSSVVPLCWTNACCSGSQKFV